MTTKLDAYTAEAVLGVQNSGGPLCFGFFEEEVGGSFGETRKVFLLRSRAWPTPIHPEPYPLNPEPKSFPERRQTLAPANPRWYQVGQTDSAEDNIDQS